MWLLVLGRLNKYGIQDLSTPLIIIYPLLPSNSNYSVFFLLSKTASHIYHFLTPPSPRSSYPNNNCAAQFAVNLPLVDPQAVFSTYTTHTAAVNLVQPYLNSTLIAQGVGKPFYMFETNTASCGGFAGVSDSFGAALWAIDYGLQLAFGNFTHGMLHTGGQNAFYNVSLFSFGSER